MRITLFFAILLAAATTTNAQITYFNYLDHTSQWHITEGGVSFGGCDTNFTPGTYHSDMHLYMNNSDTLLHGNWYYKLMTRYITTHTCPTATTTDTLITTTY